jgi:hypothetical protein
MLIPLAAIVSLPRRSYERLILPSDHPVLLAYRTPRGGLHQLMIC